MRRRPGPGTTSRGQGDHGRTLFVCLAVVAVASWLAASAALQVGRTVRPAPLAGYHPTVTAAPPSTVAVPVTAWKPPRRIVAPATSVPKPSPTTSTTRPAPPTTVAPAPTVPPTTAPHVEIASAPVTAPPTTAPSGYGCGPALSYLSTHSAPGFHFECPGYADGHQAMTCINVAGLCPGESLIAISDPCPAAYMNEAHNSWIEAGLAQGAIDPYGYCH